MQYEFVRAVPESLNPDTLYISIDFGTALHLCACGCGNEIVTPITPTDWSFTFDGESISLNPSIGNWSIPCRSHYWIHRGTIRWASQWDDEEIAHARKMDHLAKAKRFSISPNNSQETVAGNQVSKGWIFRLLKWVDRKIR